MKKLLFMLAVAVTAMNLSAAPVDQSTAQRKAKDYLVKECYAGKLMAPAAVEPVLLKTGMCNGSVTQPAYYIYNTATTFIVVAADDRAESILMVGDRPIRDINNLPPGLQDMLGQYQDEMTFLAEHPGLRVNPVANPRSRSLRAVTYGPLLTCNWDQTAPYWNECSFAGYQCYTGCPATSASMVFYYWKFPTDPTPDLPGYASEIEYSYWGSVDYNHPALPSVTFDWDNMLDTYGSSYTAQQGAAVAQLMHYVGHAEHMIYGTSGAGGSGVSVDSVGNIANAFLIMGYDPETTHFIKKVESMDNNYNEGAELYTDEEWAAIIQEEMAASRPIVFCAVARNGGGHAFNIDGYRSSDNKYHVNLGWSGEGNAWCALNSFGSGSYYNVYQQMVVGIQPPAQGPAIKVNTKSLDMNAYVNKTATATFTVKGNELTSNITLTLNDPDGAFAIDANSVAVSDQENGKVITVTYAPTVSGNHTATITLSNPDAEDKVVTLNGVATLETFTPVMLPADSAFVNKDRFRADWTDATASDYIESYTLLVNTKPTTQLLSENDWSDLPTKNGNQAAYADQYMPEGWVFEGSGFWLDGASIEPSQGCTITTNEFDLTGYEKVTVIVRFKSWSSYTAATLDVATSIDSKTLTSTTSFADYTVVLNCAEAEKLVFTAGYYPMIQNIKIYAGELEEATLRAIIEEGDANYREITGIPASNLNYVVRNLEEYGTFFYKVKALYIDGTESKWSNAQSITLFDNGHGYQLGDVDHNETVDINDVTTLIAKVLGQDVEVCEICADMNDDDSIDINDVTDLISLILKGA